MKSFFFLCITYFLYIYLYRHAQYIVGVHYEFGIQINKDLNKAKEYMLKSAMQDFAHAQAALGILLVNSNNYKEGIHWLERAATMVNNNCLFLLMFFFFSFYAYDILTCLFISFVYFYFRIIHAHYFDSDSCTKKALV